MIETFTPERYEHFTGIVNSEENPVTFLSADPGKLNGICGYDAKSYLQFMYTIQEEDINRFLKCFKKVKKCILEDYRIRPDKVKDHIYSDVLTLRVIGRFETWTDLGDITLVKQGASIKPTAYAWLGKKPLPKSNPKNHAMDAHAHFTYYAVRHGMINAAHLLEESNAAGNLQKQD